MLKLMGKKIFTFVRYFFLSYPVDVHRACTMITLMQISYQVTYQDTIDAL